MGQIIRVEEQMSPKKYALTFLSARSYTAIVMNDPRREGTILQCTIGDALHAAWAVKHRFARAARRSPRELPPHELFSRLRYYDDVTFQDVDDRVVSVRCVPAASATTIRFGGLHSSKHVVEIKWGANGCQ